MVDRTNLPNNMIHTQLFAKFRPSDGIKTTDSSDRLPRRSNTRFRYISKSACLKRDICRNANTLSSVRIAEFKLMQFCVGKNFGFGPQNGIGQFHHFTRTKKNKNHMLDHLTCGFVNVLEKENPIELLEHFNILSGQFMDPTGPN